MNSFLKLLTFLLVFSDCMPGSTSSWHANAGAWDTVPGSYIYRFYYETYTTGIHQASKADADINVYPVPAKNELNVHTGWQQPTAFTITAADVDGKVYMRGSMAATKQYDDRIPVGDLPEGNYIRSISAGHNVTSKKFTVTK